MSSIQKIIIIVQHDDVCSIHGGGVHGDGVSMGPGSSLQGTMTADGEFSNSLSSS